VSRAIPVSYDLEKIAHYAELAWTLSDGKIIKNDRDDT